MSEEERKLVEKNIVLEATLVEITPELMKKTILEQDKEIERLNKRIEDLNIINEEHRELNGMIRKELQKKENIIKEVRELVNKALNINSDYVDYEFGVELLRQELLEILDKGKE